ncbi:hypothetical protein [Albibacterium profundi]|uniref:Uncharacterized protein n=1 Tax=Albibacterium profundi TaxID=3134906 RepID=A0ABV5C9W4_9SPHI
MLSQLKKAEIDDRLLHILHTFFTEKTNSASPADRENLKKLVADILLAVGEHNGIDLRIALLQRFIMYGVNEPLLVSYYYDAFTRHSQNYNQKEKRKFVRYLIKKTQVAEYHRFYPQQPSLLVAIHTQLRAWINDIDKKTYRFDNLEKNSSSPYIKLLQSPRAFVQITRLMAEAKIFKRTGNLDEFCEFLSRVVLSNNNKKYSPKTIENSYEYRDPEGLQNTIHLLDKMKEIAEKKLDEMLRK